MDQRQSHMVDASLAFLRKLEDEMRVVEGSPETLHQPLDSSDSRSTMETPNGAERKRKRMEAAGSSEDEASKKTRIASAGRQDEFVDLNPASQSRRDMAQQLPAEVWQHVFTYLAPRTLGALLRVNRLFHKYLHPVSPFQDSAPVSRVPCLLPALSPDAIWRASRCLFWPKMPAPLRGKFEVDMWRFACARACQVCGQLDETDAAPDALPWRRGPGNNIVTPIFPFFVAVCGDCLVEKSIKEVDVLLSTTISSVIMPGLPMVFLTPDVNIVTPQAIRNTPVPLSVQLTKIYWPAQVERLQAELEDVKRFGLAATEEWIKGLEILGAETIHDASRWERWYLSGGVCQMRLHASSLPFTLTTTTMGLGSDKQRVGGMTVGKDTNHPRRNPGRQARVVTEELIAQRRVQIEARAAQLQPPIPSSALRHLPAFQAAVHKVEPFDDKEWKHLKPQLLSQHEKTKQAERRGAASAGALQKHQTKSKAKEDTETLVRIHVSALAEHFIREHWKNGRSIKKKDCARFTEGVLAYVRKQFYADFSKKHASSLTRRLVLDDMRWVFDQKIGPLINHHPKEFLFCNACPSSRPYGFHGIVQHYIAKHTSGKDNRLALQWRSEWPEGSPFSSSPMQETPTTTSEHNTEGVDAYTSRVDTMANILLRVWQVLKNAPSIPSSVKIYTLIHHIAKGYHQQYFEPAPFEMFLYGLDRHASFATVSNSHGLSCRLCVVREGKKKTFSLSALASHFRDVHGKGKVLPADWRVDMVWVPDTQVLRGLRTHGPNEKQSFELISDAFPWIFEKQEERSQSDVAEPEPEPVDSASVHRDVDERFLSAGDVSTLWQENTAYARHAGGPDIVYAEEAYGAGTPSIVGFDTRAYASHEAPNTMGARYMAREPHGGSDPYWAPARVGPRTASARDVAPEPRRHSHTYYLHHEHEPPMAERPGSRPYYPDMELPQERSHADGRHYTSSGHQQPPSSGPLYHYVQPIPPSYDRYDIVDARRPPNHYYTERPTMIREYRIPATTEHSTYTSWEAQTNHNTVPVSRAYNAYASRHPLTNRGSGSLEYDIDID